MFWEVEYVEQLIALDPMLVYLKADVVGVADLVLRSMKPRRSVDFLFIQKAGQPYWPSLVHNERCVQGATEYNAPVRMPDVD